MNIAIIEIRVQATLLFVILSLNRIRPRIEKKRYSHERGGIATSAPPTVFADVTTTVFRKEQKRRSTVDYFHRTIRTFFVVQLRKCRREREREGQREGEFGSNN